jgi:hypothetical protein
MSVTLKCKAMDANLHIWSIILNIYNVDKNKQTQWCMIKPLMSLRLGAILYYSEYLYLRKIYHYFSTVCIAFTLKCKAIDTGLYISTLLLKIYNCNKNNKLSVCMIKAKARTKTRFNALLVLIFLSLLHIPIFLQCV